MEEFLNLLQQEWAIRALIASSLVGLMCGVLGCFIVLRNMALVGDALSHAILPGVVFAFMWVGYSVVAFSVGAVVAGLITALIFTWVQQNIKTKPDAAIGIVFTAMFSIGVMGISRISRSGGVHLDLKDFLFGTVLGVRNEDLWLAGLVTVFVLVSVVVFYRPLFISTFQPVVARTSGVRVRLVHYFLMLLLSFAVVASLQTVGVILVVAMLITPASTALLLTDRLYRVLILAGIIGVVAAVLGFLLAVYFDTTPGPAMAVTATMIYFTAAIFAPRQGLLIRFFHKQKERQRILLEDYVKRAYRLQERGHLSEERLREKLEVSQLRLRQLTSKLRRRGLVEAHHLQLTTEGRHEAERLVRAHRLWETYLVKQVGLDSGQIHDDAERYEHLLPDHLIDEVDRQLGFPRNDPHGSPIPVKRGMPLQSLRQMNIGDTAHIALDQPNERISSQLWHIGLLPGDDIRLVGSDEKALTVALDDRQVTIPKDLAGRISVTHT